MEKRTFYIGTKEYGIQAFVAVNADDAKRQFRKCFELKKMPMGAVVTSNRDNGFLKNLERE